MLDVLGRAEESARFRAVRSWFGLVRAEASGAVYWESEARGVAFTLEEGIVDTVFLFGNGKDDFQTYEGGWWPG